MKFRFILEEYEICKGLGLGKDYKVSLEKSNLIDGLIMGIWILAGGLILTLMLFSNISIDAYTAKMILYSISLIIIAFILVFGLRFKRYINIKFEWHIVSEGLLISSHILSLGLFYFSSFIFIAYGLLNHDMIGIGVGIFLLVVGLSLTIYGIRVLNEPQNVTVNIWRVCKIPSNIAEDRLSSAIGIKIKCGTPSTPGIVEMNNLKIYLYKYKDSINLKIENIKKNSVEFARNIKNLFDEICKAYNTDSK